MSSIQLLSIQLLLAVACCVNGCYVSNHTIIVVIKSMHVGFINGFKGAGTPIFAVLYSFS